VSGYCASCRPLNTTRRNPRADALTSAEESLVADHTNEKSAARREKAKKELAKASVAEAEPEPGSATDEAEPAPEPVSPPNNAHTARTHTTRPNIDRQLG
jgi:hypothetical protein